MRVYIYWALVFLLQGVLVVLLFRDLPVIFHRAPPAALVPAGKAEVVLGRSQVTPVYLYVDSDGVSYVLLHDSVALFEKGVRSTRDVFRVGSGGQDLIGRFIFIEDVNMFGYLSSRVVVLSFGFLLCCYAVGKTMQLCGFDPA